MGTTSGRLVLKYRKTYDNLLKKTTRFQITRRVRGLAGGLVVKDPPASAGDTGSILDPGRCHRLWGSSARVPQVLSLRSRACGPCATTTEARARAPQQGGHRNVQCSEEQPPLSAPAEKTMQQGRPSTVINKYIKLFLKFHY